ncbi:P-loop containing nucleoside triphosphate hydrolase protein [Pavlovales sp. CCMP2436]|nr:P-loop containing nucleoside triphosphate hydrolase protein [Pavlovales sp. CCMP2436]
MATAGFPLLPITSAQTVRRIREMAVGPRDCFVASFPKSGTTWMQHIVYQLVCASAGRASGRHISEFSPFLEADRTWDGESASLEDRAYQPLHNDEREDQALGLELHRAQPASSLHRELGYRAFNTHFLPGMLPPGPAKIIYVLREALDVCTSQWHHFSHMDESDGGFTGDLTAFARDWLAGDLAFGAWAPHVEAWLSAAARDGRILLVHFEDLKTDLSAQLQRICAHLALEVTEAELAAVLPRLSFAWMKENSALFEPRSVRWVERGDAFNFLRKGESGDAPNLLSEELLQRVREQTAATSQRLAELRAAPHS